MVKVVKLVKMMAWNFWKKSSKKISASPPPGASFPQASLNIELDPELQCEAEPLLSIAAKAEVLLQSGQPGHGLSQCEKCGACCAFFHVAFPAIESNTEQGGIVPLDMTLYYKELLRAMKGTEMKHPRCIALHGVIGTQVCCSIYENRPSACRKFLRSWEKNVGNTLCDKARSVFGMQPFSEY